MESLILCTVLRLSRNLQKLPFPQHLNDMQKMRLTEELCTVICQGTDFTPLYLHQLTQAQLYSLAERQIIDTDHAKSPAGKAVLCSPDGQLFVNLNCDDHIELVCFGAGDSFEAPYARVRRWDEQFEKRFLYAFDDEFGYLSPSPAGLGTGLEASVLMHLPLLKENNGIFRTADYMMRLGLLLHGRFGSGSDASGAFYLLTNRLSMGLSESESMENLIAMAKQLAIQEIHAEADYCKTPEAPLRAQKAVAQLCQAQTLSAEDGIELLSDLRLAARMGTFPDIPADRLCALLDAIQPTTLLNANLQCMSLQELDRLRADWLRVQLHTAQQ